MRSARLPRLALVAWVVAASLIALTALGVARHLSDGTGHEHMAAQALTRAGAPALTAPLSGARLVTAWQLDAIAVLVVVLVAAAYLTAVALVPVRTGTRWPVRHTLLFLAGLAVCLFATNGSIAVYDQVLFTAHMAGHLALVMVAPALLVAGRPLSLALAALPPRGAQRLGAALRGRVVSLLTAPPVALASYTAVIVGSHLTGLMDTIMRNAWAGQLEHLVYVAVGCQFFVLVIGHEPIRWQLAAPARFALLAIAMAVDTFTGIILMQGSHTVALLPAGFAVDALSDTHTGGAIMWFGGDAIMAVVMIGLAIEWLRGVDSAPAERGWLEQARAATFATHTSSVEADDQLDDSEAARSAYNDWLAGSTAATDQPRISENGGPMTGTGTKDDPWQLTTAPGSSAYTMYRDETADPPALVCQVGSTTLRYHLQAIDDLHAWLVEVGDWVPLGAADEKKPAADGSVEAWGRSPDNPVGGWYGLRNGYRGRFGMYLPPLLETLGLVELTHDARNNSVRAR